MQQHISVIQVKKQLQVILDVILSVVIIEKCITRYDHKLLNTVHTLLVNSLHPKRSIALLHHQGE